MQIPCWPVACPYRGCFSCHWLNAASLRFHHFLSLTRATSILQIWTLYTGFLSYLWLLGNPHWHRLCVFYNIGDSTLFSNIQVDSPRIPSFPYSLCSTTVDILVLLLWASCPGPQTRGLYPAFSLWGPGHSKQSCLGCTPIWTRTGWLTYVFFPSASSWNICHIMWLIIWRVLASLLMG